MHRLQVWFKISNCPGQIQAVDLHTAVLTYGLEVAHGVVVEIAVHMIYHELCGILGTKSTAITDSFFLVAC
jgi:hypothetical protein